MAVVGPNGKDVFPAAFVLKKEQGLVALTVLVEAISHDEATGMAYKIASKLVAENEPYKEVINVVVGLSLILSPNDPLKINKI